MDGNVPGNCSVDRIVGARFRALREKAGIAGSALAETLGLDGNQIEAYERGIVRIPAAHLYKTAVFLNVSVDAFLQGGTSADGGEASQLSSLLDSFSRIRSEKGRGAVLDLAASLEEQ